MAFPNSCVSLIFIQSPNLGERLSLVKKNNFLAERHYFLLVNYKLAERRCQVLVGALAAVGAAGYCDVFFAVSVVEEACY